MSVPSRFLAFRSVVGACVLLLLLPLVAVGIAPGQAVGAIGDVLRTVTVGLAADCSPNVGTSVAVVQGRRVGLPQYPVLLVTSCLATGGSKDAKNKRSTLYFLDPATGAVVKTIQTRSGTSVFAPGDGFAQLVLAANKGLLFGCGTDGSLYSIDYISTNAVADGALAQKTKPSQATSCVGLAWDPSNNTIYQSIGGTIFHFDPAGVPLPAPPPGEPPLPASFSAPSGCTVSGLSVVGRVLLVACSGGGTAKRVDKFYGTLLTAGPTLSLAATTLSDLACDPVTFGNPPFPSPVLGETVALWSKSAATDQVMAYRAPAGMCGLPPTATVLAPAACPAAYLNADGSPRDTDGDGLWDCSEDPARWPDGKPGIDFDGDGNRDLILCATVDKDGDGAPDPPDECADPLIKNIFVEIDWMQEADGTRSHKPDPLALFAVRNAFAAAPVDAPNGIRLHFLEDEAMPHVDLLSLEPCTGPPVAGAARFDALKASFFGTVTERSSPQTINAKLMAFRYMLFAHNLIGTTSSGCGEFDGDDSAITMASFGAVNPDGDRNGTTDQLAGTAMHELGHNLGLDHGGLDSVNCKPNYLSVMNYSFQFSDSTDRPLEYSRAALETLDEATGMSEAFGIGTLDNFRFLDGRTTVHGVPNISTAVKAKLGTHIEPLPSGTEVFYGHDIDWNNNGNAADGAAVADVNKIIAGGCPGSGTVLVGHDDYANLKYNARASIDFGSGDKNSEEEQGSFDSADADHDGIRDAFGCGSSSIPCGIDIKPGENPAVLSKGQQANVKVRILSICQPGGNPKKCTLLFDATTQVLRETLTLNGFGVKLNAQGNTQGTCNNVASTGGRQDLDCQFPAAALPLGTNYGVIEGKASVPGSGSLNPQPQTFRARDVVTVVK